MKTNYLKLTLTLVLVIGTTATLLAQPGPGGGPGTPAAPFPLWALLALGATALGIKLFSEKSK